MVTEKKMSCFEASTLRGVKEICFCDADPDTINCLCYVKNTKEIWMAGRKNIIHIVDEEKTAITHRIEQPPEESGDKILSMVYVNNFVWMGSREGLVKLWDVTTRTCFSTLKLHKDAVSSLIKINVSSQSLGDKRNMSPQKQVTNANMYFRKTKRTPGAVQAKPHGRNSSKEDLVSSFHGTAFLHKFGKALEESGLYGEGELKRGIRRRTRENEDDDDDEVERKPMFSSGQENNGSIKGAREWTFNFDERSEWRIWSGSWDRHLSIVHANQIILTEQHMQNERKSMNEDKDEDKEVTPNGENKPKVVEEVTECEKDKWKTICKERMEGSTPSSENQLQLAKQRTSSSPELQRQRQESTQQQQSTLSSGPSTTATS